VVALPETRDFPPPWHPEAGLVFDLLSKPSDEEAARQMLRRLAGRTHMVVTGWALRWPEGSKSGSDASYVSFRELSDAEIRAYVATGEPLDKAGAYGVQGYAKDFVQHVEGSLSNVIGLPQEALEQALKQAFPASE
jgi:septum formation protein